MKKTAALLSFMIITGMAYAQNPGDYILLPSNNVTLPVSSKTTFSIYVFNAEGKMEMPDVNIITEWTINGQAKPDPSFGKLSSNLTFITAGYQAPDKVPVKNPVAVAVSFTLPGPAKTKLTLVCNITITDIANYFDLQTSGVPNTIYQFDDPFAGSMASAALTMAIEKKGVLVISIGGKEKTGEHGIPPAMSMALIIDGDGTGDYDWKLSPENQSTSGTTVTLSYAKFNGQHFAYASADCLPHGDNRCKGFTLKGTTTITRYDKAGGKIEGYFSGEVMGIDQGGHYSYANTYGKFTAILKQY